MMISAFGLLLLVAVTVDSSSTPAANLQPMTANSRAQYVFENPVSVTTEGELKEWSPHPAETKTEMADHENNVRSERVMDVPIEISTLANYEDADSAPGSHCPKGCDCIELTDGTSYNCSLPSGVVAFDEFGDGIIFKCLSGTLRCSEVPSGGGSAGAFAANATVRSVSLQGCALPEEPVLCALRRRGATSAQRLTLKRPLTPLSAEHVRGLGALTMLRITDLDGEEARLPLAAIASLPLLQHLTLDNAHLILREELPSLPLRALELADDALQTLPHAPFRHLQQLRRLGLWHNRFEQLPADALQGLSSLQELSFSSNRLATLPGTLLASTPQLRNLDLYDNELRFLPRSLFAGLAFLEQVRLNDNRGELTLEEGTFSGLTSLTELELSRSGLRSLPADTFSGCSALKRLLLSGNSLASLPDNLLRGLPALAHLDLSRNELSAIPPSLFADQQNLVELYLDHNSFETLTSSMFLGLSNLELLSLSHNKLRLIAYDAFTTLRSLLRLNLAHNELSFGDDGTGGANGAEGPEGYLLLGGPPSPFNGMTLLTNLDLSHNRVHQMLDDWRIVLTALKRLNLSWNNFSQFDYVSMSFLGSNVVVDLRNNNISTVDLQGDSNGSAVILLDGNPFACDCHAPALQEALAAGVAPPAPAPLPPRPRLVAPSATCAEPPHLRGLSLLEAPRNQLRCSLPSPQCPSDCSCFLLPDHLALDCDTLPPRLPSPIDHQLTITHLRLHNVTGSLPSLPAHVRRLDLSKLNITQVPQLPPNIEVDLASNYLTKIPREALTNNNTLWLARNPLECDCDHKWDVAALQRAGSTIILDYKNLTCSDLKTLRSTLTESLCVIRDNIIYGSVTVVMVFFIVVVIMLVRRYSAKCFTIAHWFGCCPPEAYEEREYDAFVSYSHQDSELAEKILIRLEAPPHSLRLCYHHRDWVAGDWIPAQIARSVEQSRWTIILLSKHFMESVWGLFEFRQAYLRALTGDKVRILIVLVEDVMSDPRMNDELRTYLATNTYLHIDDPQFWDKLPYAVRRRRAFLEALRRPRPTPAITPAPPADKLLGSALEAKIALDGNVLNGAFISPSVVDLFTNTITKKEHNIDAHVA